MVSYWEKQYWISNADIVIIGSGIVGINTAINLKERFSNSRIVVIERGSLPTGASTKNAGFACFGTVGEIIDDLKSQSTNEVIETIRMRWDGLNLLRSRVPLNYMNYENLGGTEVFSTPQEYEVCENELNFVNQIIYEAIGEKEVITVKKQGFSPHLHEKTFFNKLEGQLNPALMMKFLLERARSIGIDIINGIGLLGFEESNSYIDLKLEQGFELKAGKVIFCTNAFTKKFFSDVDVKPGRNQVIVSQEFSNLPIKGTFHFDCGYVYFRNIGKRILIGGARNIDPSRESTTDFGPNDVILSHLKAFAKEKLQLENIIPEFQWSGIIATGNSKKPIIQQHSDRVYLAVRLGGMGVAVGSQVAKSITDLI